LDVYGGEYEFDNYTVKLHNNRGMNRGVSIRYGKNLTDIQQEQNCSSVATGVYPYWVDENGANLVELPERIVNAQGKYNFVRIRPLDLSSEFETRPTTDQLRSKAEDYVKENNIGVPNVSLSVSFAQLEQTEEYKHMKLLEHVSLFDTVNVEFPALNVSTTAKVINLVYDVILDRVKSISIGSFRTNIADTIVNQQQEIQRVPTKTDLQKAKEAATAWLTNGMGYAYFRKDAYGNIIDLLFMDTQDVNTAVNVMRVGQSGIGFSHNGVGGPYESAWTIDGKFVADFITTGTLRGLLFEAGVIQSVDGKIIIDLSKGSSEPIFNSGISTNGLTIRADEAGSQKLFNMYTRQIKDELYAGVMDFYAADGAHLVSLSETFNHDFSETTGVVMRFKNQNNTAEARVTTGTVIAGFDLFARNVHVGSLYATADGRSELDIKSINGKEVSWKDSGDGSFVLVGE
jgi:hypothetical protein